MNQFVCNSKKCALYSNAYQEVVAKALNYVCPSCKESLIKKAENAWYQIILQRDDCWEKESLEFMPSIVAFEYWRLLDLFSKNKIYGALIQLKDVFEVLIKFPVLTECSRLYHLPKRSEQENFVLFSLMNKMLSLGDWERLASLLSKIHENSNHPISMIIRKTVDLYQNTKIVSWRNHTIGHGALGFEEDDCMRLDFEKKLVLLAEYLKSIKPYYERINLKMICTNRAIVLRGENPMTSVDYLNSDLVLETENTQNSLLPYIFCLNGKIFLFDSLNSWIELSLFLNYSSGKKHKDRVPELNSLLHQLRRNTNLKLLDSSTDDGEYSYMELEAIKQFQKEEEIYQNDSLVNWIKQSINENENGVFLLQMERGTGKTSFSRSLDQLTDGDQKLEGFSTRGYYINDTVGYKTDNFTTCLSDNFRCDKTGKLLITGKIPLIDADHENPAICTANFLNFFHRKFSSTFCKDKLLLIIDGLDEIPSSSINRSIFDFIPDPRLLNKGVYILLTARTNDEIPISLANKIDALSTNSKHIVYRKSSAYLAFINSYLKTLGYSEDSGQLLLEKSEFRMLYLSPLCRLLKKNKIQFNDLPSWEDIISCYIEIIKSTYDDKYQDELLTILLAVTTAYEPLTIYEVCSILWNRNPIFRDIAYLHDLSSLLNIQRSPRGNLLAIAHYEYKQQIKSLFFLEIELLVNDYISKVDLVAKNNNTLDLANIYLLAYLPEYSKEYLKKDYIPENPTSFFERINMISNSIEIKPNKSNLEKLCKCKLKCQVLEHLFKIKDYKSYLKIIKETHPEITYDVIKNQMTTDGSYLLQIADQISEDYQKDYLSFYRQLSSVLYRHQELERSISIVDYLYKSENQPIDFLNLVLMLKSTDIPIDNKPGMIIAYELIEKAILEGFPDSFSPKYQAYLYFSLARIYGDMKEKWIEARLYFIKSRDLFKSQKDFANKAISEHSLALALFDAGEFEESLTLLNDCKKTFEAMGLFDNQHIKEPFLLNHQIIHFICFNEDINLLQTDTIYNTEVLQYHLNNLMLIRIVQGRFSEAVSIYKEAMISINEKGGYYSKAALSNNYYAIQKDKDSLLKAKKITEETNYSLGNIIVRLNLREFNNSDSFGGFIFHNGVALWPCIKNIDLIINQE